MVLLVLVGALLAHGIAEAPLPNTDDALYGAIARSVTEGKVYPLFAGELEYNAGKPPFFYWLSAGFAAIFGVDEVGLRVFPILSALLAVAAIWWCGLRLTRPSPPRRLP